MARFINLLGNNEITLKSDTEPAIVLFRNRVSENCRGHTGGCNQRRQAFKRVGRKRSDVVARCHQNHQVPCGEESYTQEKLREDSPVLPWLVEHAGEHFVQVPEGSRQSDAIRKIAWQEANTRICSIQGEGAGKNEPSNRMNPRYKFGVWLGVRNKFRVLRGDGRRCIQSARGLEHHDRWDKEAINNVIGVPWRLVDGKWTVDRPVTQLDPLSPPPVPFEGERVQRENHQKRH